MSLKLENVVKQYGLQPAIHQLSLEIQPGELVALLGPSGCGKTTLLRSLAGLESLSGGRIWFGDQEASQLSVQERRVGFVFQHYALFRHLTVFENVAFGLRLLPRKQRPSRQAIEETVTALLERVQLLELAQRKPDQLSGGQRQRVALARALAINPQILLLDEPFGALDAQVRRSLRQWLRLLHDELKLTTVMVTHDQEEALEMADRVVVMNRGKVEQIGTPREVYEAPATAFVMDFLGHATRLSARQGQRLLGDTWTHQTGRQTTPLPAPVVYLRPDEITLHTEPVPAPTLVAQVHRLGWLAGRVLVELIDVDGHTLEASLSSAEANALSLCIGQPVHMVAQRLHAFDAITGQRLPDAGSRASTAVAA